MDEFGCDYACRTVGESITKHNIPDDWCAEFDAYDGVYPIICIPVGRIRAFPAMMNLALRTVGKEDGEYAGCMVFPEKKTVAFKVGSMGDLVRAIE